MTHLADLREFECLTEHPYNKFLGDEGCGFRWSEPHPIECPRCHNIYFRDLTATKQK